MIENQGRAVNRNWVFSFFLLIVLGSAPVLADELKPYQKEALEKLEAAFGKAAWPMIRQQYEGVIAKASEKEAKTIVEMTIGTQGGASSEGGSESSEVGNGSSSGNGASDYRTARAARKDLEKQIDPVHDSFIRSVAQLGAERDQIADQARRGIYAAEKGARLQAVGDMFAQSQFLTHQSLREGIEQVRLAREKLVESKKFYKVDMPSGNPPDTAEAVKTIIQDTAEQVKELNNRYGKIAADIKKRIDAIPYGGGVDVNKALKALLDEREGHNKDLGAQVTAVVKQMNARIADEDRKVFEWILKPLREAAPRTGSIENN